MAGGEVHDAGICVSKSPSGLEKAASRRSPGCGRSTLNCKRGSRRPNPYIDIYWPAFGYTEYYLLSILYGTTNLQDCLILNPSPVDLIEYLRGENYHRALEGSSELGPSG